jgi:hypothetical protein
MNNVRLDTHGRAWADNGGVARLKVSEYNMWTLAAGKAYAQSVDDEMVRLLAKDKSLACTND